MIDPDCPICFGIGWVCENHPNRAVWRQGCLVIANEPTALKSPT
jgi:hypothetical protein